MALNPKCLKHSYLCGKVFMAVCIPRHILQGVCRRLGIPCCQGCFDVLSYEHQGHLLEALLQL